MRDENYDKTALLSLAALSLYKNVLLSAMPVKTFFVLAEDYRGLFSVIRR